MRKTKNKSKYKNYVKKKLKKGGSNDNINNENNLCFKKECSMESPNKPGIIFSRYIQNGDNNKSCKYWEYSVWENMESKQIIVIIRFGKIGSDNCKQKEYWCWVF